MRVLAAVAALWAGLLFVPAQAQDSASSASASAAPSFTAPPAAQSTLIFDSVPIRYVLGPGQAHQYEMHVNDDQDTIFIALNVCGEPYISQMFDLPTGPSALSLYYSSTNLTAQPMQQVETFLGLANATVTDFESSSVFIDVVAPELPNISINGNWSYELVVSSKLPAMAASTSTNLYLVDSDFANALFVTGNYSVGADNELTTNISDYNLFVYKSVDAATPGIQNKLPLSYCGISTGPALLNQNNAVLSETRRGEGDLVKGQIFVNGLNKSESYIAYLTLPSQGIVYEGVPFSSKSGDNCQVVYDLDFCSDVAFAVPGNASAFNTSTLRTFYDSMAIERYANFSKSLDIVPCNASEEIAYSPLKGCDDCALSYKQWLCAITVPRCADWSNNASYLLPRKEGQSRNPAINEVVKPGSYKEILPCIDLCYSIVQDCSPAFGFICPAYGTGQDQSYGIQSDDGDITCSYPGAVYYLPSAAARLTVQAGLIPAALAVAAIYLF